MHAHLRTSSRLSDHGTFGPSTQDLGRSRSDPVLEIEPTILEAICTK
jgi:hypothetical protein